MPERGKYKSSDCRADLLNALFVSKDRVERGKRAEVKKLEIEEKLKKVTQEIEDTKECALHLKNMYKNIEYYDIKHSENARAILNAAIEEAGLLVPDANVDGIHLQYGDDKRVIIVNGKGDNVNLREGGAYRVILGCLIRYAALKADPSALQLILMDEQFFTLSDVTTSMVKPVLEAMKKDISIVGIEQRRNVLDGLTDAEYRFVKGEDGVTNVIKEA